MRFQIDAVRAGTSQAVRVELEGQDLQSVMAQATEMGLAQVRVRPMVEGAGGPPPIPGAGWEGARGAGAGGMPPPVPAGYAAQPPAYQGMPAYGGNVYAGQPGAYQMPPGYPAPARAGGGAGRLWLAIGVPIFAALVITGVLLLIFLWPKSGGSGSAGSSAGMASGSRLNPQLYLPEGKKGFITFAVSGNVPAILKVDLAQTLRKQYKVDDLVSTYANLSLDDVDELLFTGIGAAQGNQVSTYGIVRLRKDLAVKEIMKNPQDAPTPQSMEGYDVYVSPADAAGGKTTYLTKLGSKTYLIGQVSEDEWRDYLKRVKSGKSTTYSPALTAALKELGGGDVVVLVDAQDESPDAPTAIAVGLLTAPTSVSGTAKMKLKDEAAAQKVEQNYNDKEKANVEKMIPGLKLTRAGVTVTVTASMTTKDLEEQLKGPLGRMLGL